MNVNALCTLTYGMYIISTEVEGKKNGQIANVGGQLTSVPPHVGICLNKNTLTCEMILKRKAFTLSVLSEDAPMKFIGRFGFRTGRTYDKFVETEHRISSKSSLPIVTECCVAFMDITVDQVVELPSYYFFIGTVIDADTLSAGVPMTYAYYHAVKGGKSSKNAPTYVEGACEVVSQDLHKKYRCTICSYIYDPAKGDPENAVKPGVPFEVLPADWQCPLCGKGKEKFVVQ